MILDARVGEESLQPVIIALQDGIELVVVAAGAAIRHADKRCRYGVGDVVQQLLTALHQIAGIAFVGKMAIEAGGHQGCGVARIDFVSRDLLLHEAIVRLVGVETIDDVISIAPDIGPRLVALEAFAVGVAGEVQPVPSPAFAIMRRSEQPVNHFRERVGRGIGDECLHFFRRGRQPDQIERRPPDQGDLVGRSGRRKPLVLQLCEDEGVDRIAYP